MKVNKKSSFESDYNYEYGEVESSYFEKINLSCCSISGLKKDSTERLFFFVPEIGMSYRSYFPYFEKILSSNICNTVITFDHFGNGISGGARGVNISGKKYLEDCKRVFLKYAKNKPNAVIFGHGFGATLALILESEGFFSSAQGLIIKDPFFSKFNKMKKRGALSFLMNSKKVKRYLMQETFFGKEYFPTIVDQLDFEVDCINTRSFSQDFLETLNELTTGVIERAYLAEKPILFLHGIKEEMKNSGELISLYQKGVGEKKVTSVELTRNGHFENFRIPDVNDLGKLESWLKSINEGV